jgi:hypothetical protein
MYDPAVYTPGHVNDLVKRLGGTNEYGKPKWRVVLSERRTSKTKGLWLKHPDGELEEFVPLGRDGKGNTVFGRKEATVTSVVEVRETPVWPHKGWILERWMPAETWGTKADWNYDLGPYPNEGDYFMILGPWPEIPNATFLEQQLQIWNREWDARPTDFNKVYSQYVYEKQERERKEQEEAEREFMAFLRSETTPIMKSTSLEAQRLRQRAGRAAGVKSHIPI